MSINSYKMSEGTLVLGTAPLDVSAQMTKVLISASENVTETDPIPVLSGEELVEDDEVAFDWTLDGSLFQDLSVTGVIEWSWNQMGTWQSFVFIPDNPSDRGVAGQVRVQPISIGGDVSKKERAKSDFSWKARGADADHPNPIFGVADPVEDTVTEDV